MGCLSLQLQPLDNPLQVQSQSQNIVLSRDGECQSLTLTLSQWINLKVWVYTLERKIGLNCEVRYMLRSGKYKMQWQ